MEQDPKQLIMIVFYIYIYMCKSVLYVTEQFPVKGVPRKPKLMQRFCVGAVSVSLFEFDGES